MGNASVLPAGLQRTSDGVERPPLDSRLSTQGPRTEGGRGSYPNKPTHVNSRVSPVDISTSTSAIVISESSPSSPWACLNILPHPVPTYQLQNCDLCRFWKAVDVSMYVDSSVG